MAVVEPGIVGREDAANCCDNIGRRATSNFRLTTMNSRQHGLHGNSGSLRQNTKRTSKILHCKSYSRDFGEAGAVCRRKSSSRRSHRACAGRSVSRVGLTRRAPGLKQRARGPPHNLRDRAPRQVYNLASSRALLQAVTLTGGTSEGRTFTYHYKFSGAMNVSDAVFLARIKAIVVPKACANPTFRAKMDNDGVTYRYAYLPTGRTQELILSVDKATCAA